MFLDEPTNAATESVCLSSSLIDAHAGAISMLVFGDRLTGNIANDLVNNLFENVLCMISGTSTCHMILNKRPCITKGVWGPYFDAIIPGYYLREAGQSATGQLIERVIKSHYNDNLPSSMSQIITKLNEQLQLEKFDHRTKIVVNPTFHGNRSPLANPHLRGAIYGLTLDSPSLLDLYVATVEAIAYETRYIIERIANRSEQIRKIIVTGGLAKNDFYLQLHSDILDTELVTVSAGEADLMLVGASIIALTSIQCHNDSEQSRLLLVELLTDKLRLASDGLIVRVFKPRKNSTQYHQSKYECYRSLLDCCLKIEAILSAEH